MQQQQDGRILRSGLAVEDLDAVDGLGPMVGYRIGRSRRYCCGAWKPGALRPRTGSGHS